MPEGLEADVRSAHRLPHQARKLQGNRDAVQECDKCQRTKGPSENSHMPRVGCHLQQFASMTFSPGAGAKERGCGVFRAGNEREVFAPHLRQFVDIRGLGWEQGGVCGARSAVRLVRACKYLPCLHLIPGRIHNVLPGTGANGRLVRPIVQQLSTPVHSKHCYFFAAA